MSHHGSAICGPKLGGPNACVNIVVALSLVWFPDDEIAILREPGIKCVSVDDNRPPNVVSPHNDHKDA